MNHLVIHGGGRMGREVALAAAGSLPDTAVTVVSPRRPEWLAQQRWQEKLDGLKGADLIIDFSLPGGTEAAAAWARHTGTPLVSGTTGLGQQDEQALDAAAVAVPVLWAPNLSKGVNVLKWVVGRISEMLGDATEVDILDVHHAGKQDAPSGTAVALADAVSTSRSDAAAPVRCHSIREGEVIGDHDVRFRFGDEEITVSHHALDRGIWAVGALEAGGWLRAQAPGRYDIEDWLEIG